MVGVARADGDADAAAMLEVDCSGILFRCCCCCFMAFVTSRKEGQQK